MDSGSAIADASSGGADGLSVSAAAADCSAWGGWAGVGAGCCARAAPAMARPIAANSRTKVQRVNFGLRLVISCREKNRLVCAGPVTRRLQSGIIFSGAACDRFSRLYHRGVYYALVFIVRRSHAYG